MKILWLSKLLFVPHWPMRRGSETLGLSGYNAKNQNAVYLLLLDRRVRGSMSLFSWARGTLSSSILNSASSSSLGPQDRASALTTCDSRLCFSRPASAFSKQRSDFFEKVFTFSKCGWICDNYNGLFLYLFSTEHTWNQISRKSKYRYGTNLYITRTLVPIHLSLTMKIQN